MYADFIVKIKNAMDAKKESVKTPYSRMNFAIAELLVRKNVVEKAEVKGRPPKKILEIKLKNAGKISVRFISKSSRAVYLGYRRLRPVKNGRGILILSTPKGIKEGFEAKKEKIGGKALFEIY